MVLTHRLASVSWAVGIPLLSDAWCPHPSLENRFTSMEARFETLIGKVVEIHNRLTRVEAILERH